MHFIQKDTFVHYLSNGTLGSIVALLEAELQQFPCKVIFGGFWVLTSAWALMNRKKLLNRPKIALLGNSASKRTTMLPKVPFER